MKAILKFVTGNSLVTPAGVTLAVIAAVFLGRGLPWIGLVYAILLIVTLAASTFERV